MAFGHPTRRHPVLHSPAAPRRPAVRRAGTNRPWYVRVLDSTGNWEFVCSCFHPKSRLGYIVYYVLEILEGKRDGCFLGGPTRRRPVLPGFALPRRYAVCRRTPTRPWYVRVWVSTSTASTNRVSTAQQPRKKGGRSPNDKLLTKQSSTPEGTSRTLVHGVLAVEMYHCSLGASPRLAPPRPVPPRPAWLRLALLRPAAPPCPAPSCPARGIVGFWIRQILKLP